jgi:hypothetical protein
MFRKLKIEIFYKKIKMKISYSTKENNIFTWSIFKIIWKCYQTFDTFNKFRLKKITTYKKLHKSFYFKTFLGVVISSLSRAQTNESIELSIFGCIISLCHCKTVSSGHDRTGYSLTNHTLSIGFLLANSSS